MKFNGRIESSFIAWIAERHGDKHLDHSAFDTRDMRESFLAGYGAALEYVEARLEGTVERAKQLAGDAREQADSIAQDLAELGDIEPYKPLKR